MSLSKPLRSKQWSCSELSDGNAALIAAKREAATDPEGARALLKQQMEARYHELEIPTKKPNASPWPSVKAIQRELSQMDSDPWQQVCPILLPPQKIIDTYLTFGVCSVLG